MMSIMMFESIKGLSVVFVFLVETEFEMQYQKRNLYLCTNNMNEMVEHVLFVFVSHDAHKQIVWTIEAMFCFGCFQSLSS